MKALPYLLSVALLALLHSTAFGQTTFTGTVSAGSFYTYGPAARYYFNNIDDATGTLGYAWSASALGASLTHSQVGTVFRVDSTGKVILFGPAADKKLTIHQITPQGGTPQFYGLGYQANQFRFHLGGTTSRFSFLDDVNGNERFTIHSTGAVGVGTTTIPTGYLMAVNGKMLTNAVEIGTRTDVIPADYLMAVKGKMLTDALGVGTGSDSIPTGFLMAVKGKMITEGVQVGLASAWPDYVFKPAYRLKPLSEVETFIRTQGHLPNIPSARQVKQQGGIRLGEMNAKLLEKIEELTLYLIEEQQAREKLANEVKTLQEKLDRK
jgi:hypothetical protein